MSQVKADENYWKDTYQGNDTEDKIFLLSVNDVEKYFKIDDDRKCMPTIVAVDNGCLKHEKNGQCYWWLRSLGSISYYATLVDSLGSVDYNGSNIYSTDVSVRPALWLNLES